MIQYLLAFIIGGALWFYYFAGRKAKQVLGFRNIGDNYKTLEEVQRALRTSGLESSNLIIGVDYTKSNEWTGEQSFGGRCLHQLLPEKQNPYEQVISIISRTLGVLDEDQLVPVFGFGDVRTTDKRVFPFFPDRPCYGLDEILSRYREITPNIQLSGPTSFAPLIKEAINVVQATGGQYHILLIIADGQVTKVEETVSAIVEASVYALSIVMIGVGDGPWDMMMEFDDKLPQRCFDNFQFVEMNAHWAGQHPDSNFAINALMEIPDQFRYIKKNIMK
eukprot:GFYU01001103.1.p1 GENE.GFYU01001103.1~~GFYU01001103.1.p1  ORF type:complete len:312 (+),score=61.09 GFYU01001103.1:107-937(+)